MPQSASSSTVTITVAISPTAASLRPPPRHNDHLIDLFKIEQPIGDIDHDITHADDRNPPADLESPLAERRQGIVVIDDILRVINTDGVFSFDAELLGALRARSYDDGTEAHGFEIVQCQSLVLSDCHVTEIKDFGIGENFFKLLTQSSFHLLFFYINAVFG